MNINWMITAAWHGSDEAENQPTVYQKFIKTLHCVGLCSPENEFLQLLHKHQTIWLSVNVWPVVCCCGCCKQLCQKTCCTKIICVLFGLLCISNGPPWYGISGRRRAQLKQFLSNIQTRNQHLGFSANWVLYPKMDGLWLNILLKQMILGYPHFRKLSNLLSVRFRSLTFLWQYIWLESGHLPNFTLAFAWNIRRMRCWQNGSIFNLLVTW